MNNDKLNPSEYNIGESNYSTWRIQPVDVGRFYAHVCWRHRFYQTPYLVFILKYMVPRRNGEVSLTDLRKALHFVEMHHQIDDHMQDNMAFTGENYYKEMNTVLSMIDAFFQQFEMKTDRHGWQNALHGSWTTLYLFLKRQIEEKTNV